jgi:hypothetical protein
LENGLFVANNFTVSSVDYNPSMGKTFKVSPAVPTGYVGKISVQATVCPPCLTMKDLDTELPCNYIEPLKMYARHRAELMNQESVTSVQLATNLRNYMLNVMQIGYKRDSQMGSGYVLGQIGKGDPQPGR